MDSGFQQRFVNEEKGIGLFATRNWDEGDILFSEEPLISAQFCWNEACHYDACHHCLRPLETTQENVRRLTGDPTIVLPHPELCPTDKACQTECPDCGVRFCSEDCKERALTLYHNLLCAQRLPRLREVIEVWKNMHYPPETGSIVLILRILASIDNAPKKDEAIRELLQFSHGTEDNKGGMVSKVVGKDGAQKIQQLLRVMLDVLPPAEGTMKFLTEEGLTTLFALVGRNGQGIGSSPLSEWVKRTKDFNLREEERQKLDDFIDCIYATMDEHSGDFLNTEGSGLYKMARCLNHSCNPNAEVIFPRGDHLLGVRLIQPVMEGEEISISYLDECVLSRSRHSRRKALRDFYLFDCWCSLCIEQADEPNVTSEEEEDEED